MEAINWFQTVVTKHYIDFQGRARRAEFWWFILVYIVIDIVLTIIDNMLGTPILSGLFGLAMLLPSIGVAVRRLHDTNRTGWWVLLPVVPFILGALCLFVVPALALVFYLAGLACMILLIVWYATAGTSGSNQYGPDPKAGGAGMAAARA